MIGASVPRVDALAKVTGTAEYPADRFPPDALQAVVVFSNQVHARMLSLDASAALATPGVVAVLTAADVPVNEYGLTMFDQPVMVGVGDTGRAAVPADVSRWEADHVALVIAEDEGAARLGGSRIAIEWEQLAVVDTLEAATAPAAPILHPELPVDSNVYLHYKARKGDVGAGWEAADVVVEGTYELPHQEHAYLQPEAAMSYVDAEDRITVEIAGQWTYEDLEQIAHALDVPGEKVRVVYPAIGGAFGGREDMSLQVVMALAAQTMAARGDRRPIVTRWSREESIVGHHKRHRARVNARWGATTAGEVVVAEADVLIDAGAYNYTTNKVLGNLHLTCTGPYRIPNVRIDSKGVYTTSVPGGAFRGFGGPQGVFVAESQMNRLAAALGIDPVELRMKNLIREGEPGITHTPFPPGVSIAEVVAATAEAASWNEPLPVVAPVRSFRTLPGHGDSARRGRGFACAFKNVGFSFGFPERSEATVELHGRDALDRAVLYAGGAEVGQGGHTAWRQIAAAAIGIPPEDIETRFSDTATSGDSGSASASRLTFMAGNAILGAVEEAQKAWIDGERPAVGSFRYEPPPTEMLDPDGGPSTPNFSYGYVAQVVEVTLDAETGTMRVDRVVSTSDAGTIINPHLVEGQTEGAVAQAHGYAAMERLVVDGGRIVNPRLSQYLIPGIGDVPREVVTVLFDGHDPLGPLGARGMAEMPFLPYGPALTAAIHDATGVWVETLPVTPEALVRALAT